MPCMSVPGGLQIFGGSPFFRGGVSSPGGLQIIGGSPNFRGVSRFSGEGLIPEYGQRSAGTHPTGMHSC